MVDTLSNLGNVFRNSKWSDLQIQNIKTSLVSHKTYFLLTVLFVALFYILVLPYLYYVLYGTILNIGRIVFSITQTLTCVISMNFVIFTYLFKHFFKNFEQNVVLKVTQSHELQKPLKINFSNSSGLADYDTKLISSLYKLSNSLLLFENSKAIVNWQTGASPYLNNSLDYNSRILSLDLFKVAKSTYDTSDLYTVRDSEFLPSSTTLESFTSNNTYNLLPAHLNNTKEGQHSLLLNLLSTQKSNDILKQSRWSLKNSLISEEFIKQNNMFLNSKRLLGTTFSAPALTDHNIWVSNFKTGNSAKNTILSPNLNNNEVLKSFNTFEESRNFMFTRYLLFINNKTLLPTKALVKQFSGEQRHLNYNTANYFLTQEYFTKTLFTNNNVLFLNTINVNDDANLAVKFGEQISHTNNTNNSLEFLLTSSAAITSDLTSTKPSTTTTLPTNKNLSL